MPQPNAHDDLGPVLQLIRERVHAGVVRRAATAAPPAKPRRTGRGARPGDALAADAATSSTKARA